MFFLLTTVLQQAASVLASLTLRSWGEHNREVGSNRGMMKYLIIYGLFSLSSTILGGISAILMWVYCALRSARRLHDGVRSCRLSLSTKLIHELADVGFDDARSVKLLRIDSNWTVRNNYIDARSTTLMQTLTGF